VELCCHFHMSAVVLNNEGELYLSTNPSTETNKRTNERTNKETISMELILSRKDASRSATQGVSNILWNPKVHNLVHKSPPIASIMSQKNELHTAPSNLRPILMLSSHLCLGLHRGLFPSDFPIKPLYELFSSICGSVVVKALCYKPEGRGFDTR
jgi:hypothetical protein